MRTSKNLLQLLDDKFRTIPVRGLPACVGLPTTLLTTLLDAAEHG